MVEYRTVRVAEVERGDTVGGGTGLGGAAQADHQIRADGIGGRGTLGVRGRAVGGTRQERLHADRRHPAFEATCQVPQDVRLADRAGGTVHDQTVIDAAAARIDDDPLAGQAAGPNCGPALPRGWRAEIRQ